MDELVRSVRQSFVIIGFVLLALLVVSGRYFHLNQRAITDLHESQRMFERLFENAPDATILVDTTGQVVRANARIETVFRCRRSDIIGQSVEQLITQRSQSPHGQHLTQYFADPQLRAAASLELFALRRDGTEFPVDIMLSPIETEQGRQSLAVIRDITDRKGCRANAPAVPPCSSRLPGSYHPQA